MEQELRDTILPQTHWRDKSHVEPGHNEVVSNLAWVEQDFRCVIVLDRKYGRDIHAGMRMVTVERPCVGHHFRVTSDMFIARPRLSGDSHVASIPRQEGVQS